MAMICILVLWIAIGVVDYRCVHSFETPNSLLCSRSIDQGRLMWIYSLGDIKEAPIHNEGSLFLLLVFIVFFVETHSIV